MYVCEICVSCGDEHTAILTEVCMYVCERVCVSCGDEHTALLTEVIVCVCERESLCSVLSLYFHYNMFAGSSN